MCRGKVALLENLLLARNLNTDIKVNFAEVIAIINRAKGKQIYSCHITCIIGICMLTSSLSNTVHYVSMWCQLSKLPYWSFVRAGCVHRVHTERHRPISGVQSIMMEKSALAGDCRGCARPHPLSLYLLSCTKLQSTLQLRGPVHSLYFISTPICTLWMSVLYLWVQISLCRMHSKT
jgi:hypothetical protein